MPTIVAASAVVLPDRLASPGAVVIDGDRIVEIREGPRAHDGAGTVLAGSLVAPGFIDVHVHGVEGFDALDPEAPIASIARRLPRYGVTAFCPTTVACSPGDLLGVLGAVRAARGHGAVGGARVLPAHLESNFISPQYRGAQPLSCLVLPPAAGAPAGEGGRESADFTGQDIIDVLESYRDEVGIVTMAAELPGAMDLLAWLADRGHRVSLGHSGATYEQARAAIDAGARHATHLFNRMSPLHHRHPGLTGAVLEAGEVQCEFICDGHHVHPALLRFALGLKGIGGMIAITDGTAGSGLPAGSHARLGGRRITVRETAVLDDGTLAGSVLTMDGAFRNVVGMLGRTPLEAARLCSTTPADALKLGDQGRLVSGALADMVLLDAGFQPVRTWVGGELAFDLLPAQP
jgi:N-acetylglucosamine-6-phosphate deacetylase